MDKQTNLPSEGIKSEEQVKGEPLPTQSETKQQEKDFKKEYYKMAGKYNKLLQEHQTNSKEETIDLSNYDEEDIENLKKLARQEAKNLISSQKTQEIEEKEIDAFLNVYPEAYETIEELKQIKNSNSKLNQMSYVKLYEFLNEKKPATQTQQIVSKTNGNVAVKKEFSENDILESYNKLLGR